MKHYHKIKFILLFKACSNVQQFVNIKNNYKKPYLLLLDLEMSIINKSNTISTKGFQIKENILKKIKFREKYLYSSI